MSQRGARGGKRNFSPNQRNMQGNRPRFNNMKNNVVNPARNNFRNQNRSFNPDRTNHFPQPGPVKKILINKKTGQQITVVNKSKKAAIIRKNIENMKHSNFQKRKVAQELYYGSGVSPMVKIPSGPSVKQQESKKGSIQQRLGVNNVSQRLNRFNQNTDKFQRMQYLKNRRQRLQNGNTSNTFKAVSASGKTIQLRPLRQRMHPTNYTVSVENPHTLSGVRSDNLFHQLPYKHHVLTDLNPAIQQEIRIIQNKNRPALPPTLPAINVMHLNAANTLVDTKLPIVATRTTLHERFSMI